MAGLITSIGSVVTGIGSWITSVVGVVTAEGNEILLVPIIIGFAGCAIGFFQRLRS